MRVRVLFFGQLKEIVGVTAEEAGLSEGARVEVVFRPAEDQPETLQEALLKHAGCLTDLPADMAEQHDHYIHGTPKR